MRCFVAFWTTKPQIPTTMLIPRINPHKVSTLSHCMKLTKFDHSCQKLENQTFNYKTWSFRFESAEQRNCLPCNCTLPRIVLTIIGISFPIPRGKRVYEVKPCRWFHKKCFKSYLLMKGWNLNNNIPSFTHLVQPELDNSKLELSSLELSSYGHYPTCFFCNRRATPKSLLRQGIIISLLRGNS